MVIYLFKIIIFGGFMKHILTLFCIVILSVFIISSCSKKMDVSEPKSEIGSVNDGEIPTPIPTPIPVSSTAFLKVDEWGAPGDEDGNFNAPEGIIADSVDNIYIVDKGNNRIQKFTSNGVFVRKWGTAGNGNGEFDAPTGIAADSSNNIYVADTGNNRIQKFTQDGVYVAQWGTEGTGDTQFNGPVDVAIDGNDNVYISDGSNARILKYTTEGVFVTKWESESTGHPQFSALNKRLAINKNNNNVYVSCEQYAYIINPDGALPVNPVWLGSSESIGCDSDGNVVQVISNSLIFKDFSGEQVIYMFNDCFSCENQSFNGLQDVAFDSQGNMYLTDYHTGYNISRVLRYDKQ
ncbi:MAG: hypothetical protein CVV21_05065 [Candidatus Goldiibacteriota bacterium HGW-Goldbacteria-1]|jgi:hypothetical protein|nr:MAG: hypothetical protein CVV21_05065 [Candidatus Goldiibacteriota bacterium HGW-Goldbacteria-1]